MITIPDDDSDPVDRARACDLGDAGMPGYCIGVTIAADGTEHFALLRYNAGECDYRPTNWNLLAPHEIPGQPVRNFDL